MKNYREDLLLQQCATGNRKAQLTVYKKYASSMFTISLSILRNKALAQDAMQEGFINAFKNIDSFKGEVTFGAWLKKIVINKSITLLKKEKRFAFNSKIDQITEEEETIYLDENIDLALLKISMKQLSDQYHTLISLYYLEGYDHKEISEILNISYENSRTILSRAKIKLKKIITHERSFQKTI